MKNLIVVNPKDITFHPKNYNRHSEQQIEELARSLDVFDQFKNVVCWRDPGNNTLCVIAGEGLVRAALKRGLAKITVNDRSDLSEDRAMALMLADNLLPSTDFDPEKTAELVRIIDNVEEVPGVTPDWLVEVLGKDGGDGSGVKDPGPQVDKASELQEVWGVAEGDIWQAGPHYVICGDCREPETWRRLLAKSGYEKVNGVFTSPPYAEQRKEQYGGVPVNEYVEWWDAVQSNVKVNLADDGSFFVNIKPHCENGERVLYVFDLVLAMKRRWGWRFVDELCWKRITSPGRWPNRFKNLFEPVYHFSLADCVFRPTNVLKDFKDDPSDYQSYDRATAKTERPSGFDTTGSMKSPHFDGALPGNIIEASGAGGDGHWAAFPVALPDFFIRAYSDPGDIWLDPFLGSGTTIVAAHQADGGQRIGLGIERLPKYVSVCLERFMKLGLEPTRCNV